MSQLLKVYGDMIKEAETAHVDQNLTEMFSKYAEAAGTLLAEEYGTDYDTNDVASLANGLMERDAEILQEQEKVAEYDEIGRSLAHMYAGNMQKEAIDKAKMTEMATGAYQAALQYLQDASGTVKETAVKGAKGAGNLFNRGVAGARGIVSNHPLSVAGGALGAGAVGGAAAGYGLSRGRE